MFAHGTYGFSDLLPTPGGKRGRTCFLRGLCGVLSTMRSHLLSGTHNPDQVLPTYGRSESTIVQLQLTDLVFTRTLLTSLTLQEIRCIILVSITLRGGRGQRRICCHSKNKIG